ncbi:ferredoxin [Streptomyces sp. NBC_01728]|uniref:ferredoxin n=1 Tax=unclassified Streptomyces TaxID=2593676 RepID=UPI00225861A1|nr:MULTISPECIES: ferredoxin [unclassified Streptomyces]MCX4461483.1 ferredoxin [Streptomyces sp. NBC_01719]MCX4490390.1 ferredoxin [Streptomyces sp. NBC_01728]MCX4597193.1 ferredoxin [Streptomyces sp. NBC_01549]
MIITVEEDKCVAGGQCVVAAPEVFDQREDDGVVILLQGKPPVEEFERVRRAATMCPAAAIRLAESLRS